MAVYVTRAKKGDTNERMIKRFKKWVQVGGVFQTLRGNRFFSKKKTKKRVRDEAIMRTKYRKQREKEKLYS